MFIRLLIFVSFSEAVLALYLAVSSNFLFCRTTRAFGVTDVLFDFYEIVDVHAISSTRALL